MVKSVAGGEVKVCLFLSSQFKSVHSSNHLAFFAVYNVESTEIIAFYQMSSEKLYMLFEQFCDHFHVPSKNSPYMNFISSHSNSIQGLNNRLQEVKVCLFLSSQFKSVHSSNHLAFFAVYNVESTKIIAFYQMSSEKLYILFEQFCDHFHVPSKNSPYMNFISSHSNNIHALDQLRSSKNKATSFSLGRATPYPYIQNEANELLRIRDYLFKELAQKTGQPVEQVHKDFSRIKRFNAQEALDYGLIDQIVSPPRIKVDAPSKEAGTGLG
ncbi:hypothetical protein LXL04_020994 [Taraxacum kok-saghyz]